VLRLSWNQGKGAAVRAGLSKAYAEGFGWALLMDGDGQHDPRDIPTLLTEAEHSTAALIVGNRMPSANQMPWVRRQANRWMSRWISARAGQVLPDTQCGFRLINLAAWAVLTLKTNRFEIESEMLLAFVRGGFSVRFVTIRTIGRGPTSHIQPLEDTLRWFRWWWTAASPPSNPSSRPDTAEASAQ
jgi:glycosyltransferase involved in cell wall biosynthesis